MAGRAQGTNKVLLQALSPTVPTYETAQQLGDAIDAGHRVSWELYSGLPQEKDARGRTAQQDVDEWLLRKDVTAQLDTLLAQAKKAEAAHNDEVLRKALSRGAVLIESEMYRSALVAVYWGYRDSMAAHAGNLATLEARLPADDAAARLARLAPTESAFAAALPAAMSAATQETAEQVLAAQEFIASAEGVFAAYNAERTRLAQLVGSYERAQGKSPLVRAREEPCPEPVAPSGSDKPHTARDFPNAENFYPEASKRHYFEGSVVIEATISATGCIDKAEVHTSSGVSQLDAGALDLALKGRYVPAGHAQQGVPSTFLFRISFKLAD
jgi:TonB family protein